MERLAETYRSLPGELINAVRELQAITEQLRLAQQKSQRDAEQLLTSAKEQHERIATLEEIRERLVNLSTKLSAAEEIAAKMGSQSEHPTPQQEKE